jgi:hypothetical protein
MKIGKEVHSTKVSSLSFHHGWLTLRFMTETLDDSEEMTR